MYMGIRGWEWIIILIVFFLPIVLCVMRASKINRNKIIWGILGFLFNYVAVLILYVLAEPKQEDFRS